MYTKKLLTAFSILLLFSAALHLPCGGPGNHAMGQSQDGAAINTGNLWNANSWTNQKDKSNLIQPALGGETARRSAVRTVGSSRRLGFENASATSSRVKETTGAELIRRVLPWVASTFGVIGFGMVTCGVLARRRKHVEKIVRASARHANADMGQIIGRKVFMDKLALHLMKVDALHHQSVTHWAGEEQSYPLRRAA